MFGICNDFEFKIQIHFKCDTNIDELYDLFLMLCDYFRFILHR